MKMKLIMTPLEHSPLRSIALPAWSTASLHYLAELLRRAGARSLVLCAALMAVGCSSLPAHVDRPVSRADVDASGTALARAAAASMAQEKTSASGFRLLATGDQALEARMALIQRAEKTLDIQYYLIASDGTGLRFVDELRAAAGRGVRVRILVDDLFAAGQDDLFAGLAAHDNVEVRMFNPLPSRGSSLTRRVLLSLHEYTRINARMHNKLLLADNAFALTGGRNIADEYFDQGAAAHFIDMDILSAGPVIREFSKAFDRHWNSEMAFPVQSLISPVRHPVEARQRFDLLVRRMDARSDAGPATPSPDSIDGELAAGRLRLRFAPARVIADSPSKPREAGAQRARRSVAHEHLQLIRSARSEVLIASPYVIPCPDASAAMHETLSRGARMVIMTNSLSTTDEPLVHFAYARYRRAMLKMGVTLNELKPMIDRKSSAARPGDSRGSLARLHAKVSVVDQRWLFIGSMNMDGRSAHWNTELSLLIDSPALAADAAGLLMRERLPSSYQLRVVDGTDRIEWVGSEEAELQVVHRHEPDSRWAQYLHLTFLSMFVSEDLL
jgi:putative cardiolipin synthase